MAKRTCSKQAKVDTCGRATGDQRSMAIRGAINLTCKVFIFLERECLDVLLMYLNAVLNQIF